MLFVFMKSATTWTRIFSTSTCESQERCNVTCAWQAAVAEIELSSSCHRFELMCAAWRNIGVLRCAILCACMPSSLSITLTRAHGQQCKTRHRSVRVPRRRCLLDARGSFAYMCSPSIFVGFFTTNTCRNAFGHVPNAAGDMAKNKKHPFLMQGMLRYHSNCESKGCSGN